MLTALPLLFLLLPSCCFCCFSLGVCVAISLCCPAAAASEELCEQSVVEMLMLMLRDRRGLGSLLLGRVGRWCALSGRLYSLCACLLWCAGRELPSGLELLYLEFGATGQWGLMLLLMGGGAGSK